MLKSDSPMAPPTPRCAVVLDLPPGVSPVETMDALCADDRLALVSVVLDRTATTGNSSDAALLQLDRIIERCRRLGLDPSICDELDRSIRAADTAINRSLILILRHLLDESPFLLIRRRGAEVAALDLPEQFSAAIDALFGITIEVLSSVDEVWSSPFRRQGPRGLILAADQQLFEVLAAPDAELEQRWNDWLQWASVDDQHGILVVAPLLQERLHRLGVVNAETGRLTGLRRKAWFSRSLMKADSVEISRRLGEVGIDPVFTGDIISSLDAERDGSVRRIGAVSCLVETDEAVRALDQLTSRYEPRGGWVRGRPIPLVNQSKLGLRLDADRGLNLQWRWLPERAANLVPLTESDIDSVDLDGTLIRGLSPTTQLIELCARPAASWPGSTLAVLMQTFELIDRHHDRIDWVWVQPALERLDLTDHARVMLARMPDRVRELVPILRQSS